MNSCLYECRLTHARFAPTIHAFAYRIFLFSIDLDELEALDQRLPFFALDRRQLYSFRDSDYLPFNEPIVSGEAKGSATSSASRSPLAGGSQPRLKDRVVAYLASHDLDLSRGRVVLVTLPRIAGYLFNPVSFYFCYNEAGEVVAAIAEVTNTFREIKPYLLPRSSEVGGGASFRARLPKHFYVSPFSDVDVEFDFELNAPGERLAVRIDDYTGQARTFTSALTGARRELTGARLGWFTVKYPLLTSRIIALIHWHAFLLWLKRVPWFRKAARRSDQRDLYRPHPSIA